ncbi:MAG: ABC transporter ATP-binding protein/permease [Ignavibacteria bacterium]|nr:ABC transporter ATP-binding protein/permease [Ignavibacteria bacterium]MBT8383270.1 ABC transporter ATP-binding protein/permease [Ignavibacteria bacterium]MBT8390375.1 ABC transporter ATP-binding protein/permease [Ignavibacteria bacterium]NNJ53365.1 ABC transporter ATP-binding protein [Ignavibacteriaceae bacterium]NNL21620.1 ABC transporter ATP-binding protein [Ignavibacteriaceae bacterium]
MKTYLRILSYVRPYWKHLLFAILLSILYAVFNGVSIYLVIPLLDTLFQESSVQTTTESTTSTDSISSIIPDFLLDLKDSVVSWFVDFVYIGDKIEILMKICIVILIVFMLKNVFGYLQAYFMAYIEYASMNELRNAAYKHLHKLPLSFFKKEKVGDIISRITNDIVRIQESISATFSNLIKEPFTIIVFLVIALSISWELTLLAVIILPLSMLVIGWIGLKVRAQSTIVQEKLADITSVLQETISGVKVVKAFGMEQYENNKFFAETKSFLRTVLKVVRIRNSSSPVTEIISVFVGAVIIYYGGVLVLAESTLTASLFMGFLLAIFQMMRPIKELSTVNNRIQEASAAADRVFEILDIVPDIKNKTYAETLSDFKNTIKFENVSFKYEDSDELVLDNINFHVKKGDILALVGPSGGGKSTLVDLIPRFYDPASGRLLIDGGDIREFTLESLRSKMGIVTQETFLFNASIKQNIAYGLDDYPLEKIIEAAKTANAHNFIMESTKGYDTVIGERGVKLSGGQRQRITIARALLKNPEIMIFDEATSALDSESEMLVQEAIERLMKNRTTFVIAHRLSTIRNATKIMVIDYGKIIQSGTHDELIKVDKGLYKMLYDMQFRDS